jgi:hypothetical protein
MAFVRPTIQKSSWSRRLEAELRSRATHDARRASIDRLKGARQLAVVTTSAKVPSSRALGAGSLPAAGRRIEPVIDRR